MEIKFTCECGTTVQMPEMFAGKGCKCPACRKKMIATEAQVGPARLEIPIIEDAVEEGPHFETRKPDELFSGQDDIGYERKGRPANLPRSVRLVIAIALVASLIVFLVLRYKGLVVQGTAAKKGQSERVVEDTAPTAQAVPGLPGEGAAQFQEKPAITSVAPQPEKESALIKPTLSEPTAKSDLSPTLPPSPTAEGGIPLEQSAPTKPPKTSEKTDALLRVNETGIAGAGVTKANGDIVHQPESNKGPSRHSSTPSGRYTLNIASFREKEKAVRYRDELTQQGLDAFEWEISLPRQGKWYRVSVGKFSTHEQAVTFAGELERNLRIKAIVAQSP